MTASDIRSFHARDWGLIARSKSDYWVGQKASMTPNAVLELAGELFAYARALRPDWPNSAERDADLTSHIRLAGLLQRAAQNRAR